jgi:hypothetical protein
MISLSRIFFFEKTEKTNATIVFFFLLIYYDQRFIKYIKNYIIFLYKYHLLLLI